VSAPTFDYDSYMRAVAAEQQTRPDTAAGRVHYDVLVSVAPQVAFALTDSPYNPCFHQDRLPVFLDRVRTLTTA
jgi:hypothetical protein